VSIYYIKTVEQKHQLIKLFGHCYHFYVGTKWFFLAANTEFPFIKMTYFLDLVVPFLKAEQAWISRNLFFLRPNEHYHVMQVWIFKGKQIKLKVLDNNIIINSKNQFQIIDFVWVDLFWFSLTTLFLWYLRVQTSRFNIYYPHGNHYEK